VDEEHGRPGTVGVIFRHKKISGELCVAACAVGGVELYVHAVGYLQGRTFPSVCSF
jgi:hypothetical protein